MKRKPAAQGSDHASGGSPEGPSGPRQRELFDEPAPEPTGPEPLGSEEAPSDGMLSDEMLSGEMPPPEAHAEAPSVAPEDERSAGVHPPGDAQGRGAPDLPGRRAATPGGPRRSFLGWHRPLLDLATEWLVEEVAGSGFGFGFGLPGTTLVVPGRRAGRLLLGRLTGAAKERGHRAILPPEILTVGALPERILQVGPVASEGTLRAAVAGRLRQACARPAAGDRFVAEALETALGGRPDEEDWRGWVELARRLEDVALRLESAGLPVDRAARRVERMTGGVFAETGGESDRWQAWREIDHWLSHELEAARLPTRSQQRFEALSAGRLRDLGDLPDRLVLVGLPEVSPMVRELLGAVYGDSGARGDGGGVDCLVHAPASERERFDDHGCHRADAWSLRDGPLVEALGRRGVSTGFVERPSDQVADALGWVLEALERPGVDAAVVDDAERIVPTVGVGDDVSAERMVQGLAARGVSAHAPASAGLDATEPGRCLLLLSRYSIHGGLEVLMRCLALAPIHRWVEEALSSLSAPEIDESSVADARARRALELGDLVGFVDAVGARGIAGRPPEQLEPVARWTLERVEAAVRILVAPDEAFDAFEQDVARMVEAVVDPDVEVDVTPTRSSLGAQAALLLETLRRLASVPAGADRPLPLDPDGGHDEGIGSPPEEADLEAWERVAAALQDAEGVDASADLRLDEVAQTLLEQPDRAGEGDRAVEVEVVGWLELPFDPSSQVVVLDLNEGRVPTRPDPDPMLPESMFEALGGLGEPGRLARDAFLLTGLLHSRERVRLLACRRDESGEPLLPSRLLLAGGGSDLAGRVLAGFHDGSGSGVEDRTPTGRLWLDPGSAGTGPSSFEPVRPPTDAAALESYASRLGRLRVTDFRSFLTCPYRFFLQRVLGAEPARPWPLELDAPGFGNFVHEVLRRLGRSDAIASEDAVVVLEGLREVADRLARNSFGLDPPLSVAIQLEHLDRRFEAFATWQAAHRAAGWRAVADLTERDVSLEILVDDQPVEIVGRIDRVDRHPDLGYLLLDYKTGDRPVDAASARAAKSRSWSDVQLPLYREIARSRRDLFEPGVPVRTGLVRVSKQIGARPLSIAPWTDEDYAEALDEAREVVRLMRSGAFWPPSSPPRFPDGFEWAAGDRLVGWKPTDAEPPPSGPSEEIGVAGS